MPDEKPIPDPRAKQDSNEGCILLFLVVDQRLWSMEEIVREFGDHNEAHDAIAALHRTGLINRTSDGFVFATRAAIRADEIKL